jgi:hypothetical protein
VKSPPRGGKGKGDVVSPDVEEVAEFEKAMMAGQSPSPSSRVPGSAAGNGNGSGDGLFASSEESEEE